MMNGGDCSAWRKYFAPGPDASFFAPAIQAIDSPEIPPSCAYAVSQLVLARRGGEAALPAAGTLSPGTGAHVTPEIAIHAAHISLALNIAMPDRSILATSPADNATLRTQDADVEALDGVAHTEEHA